MITTSPATGFATSSRELNTPLKCMAPTSPAMSFSVIILLLSTSYGVLKAIFDRISSTTTFKPSSPTVIKFSASKETFTFSFLVELSTSTRILLSEASILVILPTTRASNLALSSALNKPLEAIVASLPVAYKELPLYNL